MKVDGKHSRPVYKENTEEELQFLFAASPYLLKACEAVSRDVERNGAGIISVGTGLLVEQALKQVKGD